VVVRVVVKSAWLVVASYVVLREGCFSRSERTKDVVGLRGEEGGREGGVREEVPGWWSALREGCFSRSERTKDVVGLRGRREGRKKGGWEEEKMRGKAGEVAAESESGMQ
jgi:hypothetical protein